jgi:thiol-disulfide isomerase/thioredoxin
MTAAELKRKLTKGPAKATVVNLWATWCPPCKEEMPELITLSKRYAPHGLQFILISGDSSETRPDAARFLEKVGSHFASYILAEPADRFMKAFITGWPAALPTTLLFDAKGTKIKSWVGRVPIGDLEKRLAQALGVKPPTLASPKKIRSD